MASAWGASFGIAWGGAWGGVVPVVTLPVIELLGGGYAKPRGPEPFVVKNHNDVILATVVAFVLAQE